MVPSGLLAIFPGFATCGAGGGSGNTLIYTLTNIVNAPMMTTSWFYSGWGIITGTANI